MKVIEKRVKLQEQKMPGVEKQLAANAEALDATRNVIRKLVTELDRVSVMVDSIVLSVNQLDARITALEERLS